MTVDAQQTKRDHARERLIAAARTVFATDGVQSNFVQLVCDQVGISRGAFRAVFADQEELVGALLDTLATESLSRLREGIDRGPADAGVTGQDAVPAMVASLLRLHPMDRTAALIRIEYRALALRGSELAAEFAASEDRFANAFTQVFVAALADIGLRFRLGSHVSTRIITEAYEQAFQDWLIDGHPEHGFAQSDFATRTLPALTSALAEPIGPAKTDA